MKTYSLFFSVFLIGVFATQTPAQTLTLAASGDFNYALFKDSKFLNFSTGDDFFVIGQYSVSNQDNYNFLDYNSGRGTFRGPYSAITGDLYDTYGLLTVLPVGNTAYALLTRMEKKAGKYSLFARKFGESGAVSEGEKSLMSIPFEKLLNPGDYYTALSPDGDKLVVLAEAPFDKKQQANFKIGLFDSNLSQTFEGEFTLPGENSRGKNLTVLLGNSGVVYLVKNTKNKIGEMVLTVYQYSPADGGELKEYSIEFTEPEYAFSFTCAVAPNDELIVAGTYYQRTTITVGEPLVKGVFFFTNPGLAEKKQTNFPFDTPMELMTAQKVIINGNTVFFIAEQYKRETKSQAPTTGVMFDYNYHYVHKSNVVFGLNPDGSKKFSIELAKDFSADNFDGQFHSGYFICNGKLTLVYNDHTDKYIKGNYGYGKQIPVLVQITNEGLMQTPVPFINNIRLESGYTLYPALSVQRASDKIEMLMVSGTKAKVLTVKVSD